ncbi:MAG: barstar family protein [Planctomycetota bacterium]
MLIRIDGDQITGWSSFHDVFAEVLGFPEFYGRNMAAWVDCLTSLDCPEDGMTSIHVSPPAVLTIQIDNAAQWLRRDREMFRAMVDAVAFVNWRRIETGEPAVVCLSYHT